MTSASSWIDLSGEWLLDLDADDRGIDERWFHGYDFPHAMVLPGTTDLAGFGEPGPVQERLLTRVHRHLGPAWYQREIVIPDDWRDRFVSLELERVIFESRVWVDGRPIGIRDSLVAPHEHDLGVLEPGVHTVTLRVDNRMVQPVGPDGHGYSEFTQTIWNGAIGRLALRAEPAVAVCLVRLFPDLETGAVEAEVEIVNRTGAPEPTQLDLTVRGPGGEVAAAASVELSADSGSDLHHVVVKLDQAPATWDEFAPHLYRVEIAARTRHGESRAEHGCGFRSVARDGRHLRINGRRTFVRGGTDHSIFPLTGHPPMDVAGWRRVLQVYVDHGFNQLRFHSWTPPEAAFVAADQLGVYLQVEVTWLQYPYGSGEPLGPLKELGRGDLPPSFFYSDRSPDDFVRAEMDRVLDTYGNHPSFVFFVLGNELGKAVWPVVGEWIGEAKRRDPRHLYAVATARAVTPHDDFAETHLLAGVGRVRDRIEPYSDWDYEALYAQAELPVIAHELGQWPTYPDWSEIDKYAGVLRAHNLDRCRRRAVEHGTDGQAADFRRASGALAVRLYKDQMESHLRTPSCQGFSTLSLQDYPGQGEALVGWVDAFFDSKGTVTPERFRRWCGPVVPLLRTASYVVTAGEPIEAEAVLANYGPTSLDQIAACWRLLGPDGGVLAQGRLPGVDAPQGEVTSLGTIAFDTTSLAAPAQLRLEVEADGHANDWDLWVMPDAPALEAPDGVVVTEDLATARAALSRGERVVLLAHRLGGKRNRRLAAFKPVYWSAVYFPGDETLGALVQHEHPALEGFPSGPGYDWQWWELCERGRGFELTGLPRSITPIVQPVPDFHDSRRFATIVEASTPEGGRILVCGYDIDTDLDTRPAARQLRASLLRYAAGPRLSPDVVVDGDALAGMLPPHASDLEASGSDDAVLHVVAGDPDQVVADRGFSHTRSATDIVAGPSGRAWQARSLTIAVTVPVITLYRLRLQVEPDGPWSLSVGGTARDVTHDHGGWAVSDLLREDCLGGELVIEVRTDSPRDLRVSAVSLVPLE